MPNKLSRWKIAPQKMTQFYISPRTDENMMNDRKKKDMTNKNMKYHPDLVDRPNS